jgi:PAS domain S-box-containing protein
VETNMNPLRNHSTLYHPNERELKTKNQPEDNEEAPLVRREAEQRAGQQDANKGSWQWDIRTDITTWSEQLHRIAGRDPVITVPSFREHSSFYTSDSWDQLITATLRLLYTGEPYEIELQVLRPDGTRRWVICSGEAARDTSGYILRLCGTVEDITERNWHASTGERELESMQNSTEKMSACLIKAQDQENVRIAKELQDNICQKVCLLAVGIQGLTPALQDATVQTYIRVEELWRYTSEIVAEIAQVSNQLHPSTLDLLGLPLAIRGYCREFASRSRILVECSCTDVLPEEIENEIALSFFRILEEALGNVAKHSHASNVCVELIGSSRELLLRVSDNGVGFELQKTKVATGLGFIRMRERLRSMGGGLAVWSTPTRGSRIEARAPLNLKRSKVLCG